MSLSTSLDQTYFKLHCNTCGCTTPHRDNSTTIQCEVCLYSNHAFSANVEYCTGWELAFFWQQKYRSVVGYGAPVRAALAQDVYGMQSMQAGVSAVASAMGGVVMLAEAIAGGILVSKADTYPTEADKVGYPDTSKAIDWDREKTGLSDLDQMVQHFQNPFIDPNSIGTL